MSKEKMPGFWDSHPWKRNKDVLVQFSQQELEEIDIDQLVRREDTEKSAEFVMNSDQCICLCRTLGGKHLFQSGNHFCLT